MQIPIDIPDGLFDRYAQAFALKNKWPATILDPNDDSKVIPNPYSIKQNFFDQMTRYAQDVVVFYELELSKMNFEEAEKKRIEEEIKLPDIKAQAAVEASDVAP